MTKSKPEEFDAVIGSRMRAQRRRLGLSQTQLGNCIGITYQQIQKYETGRNKLSPGRLLQIARCLEVTPEWLFGDVKFVGALGDASVSRFSDAFHSSEDLLSAFTSIADASLRSLVIEFVEYLTQRPELASEVFPTRACELRLLLEETGGAKSLGHADVANREIAARHR